MLRPARVVAICALAGALPGAAAADILIEAHRGARPADAEAVLQPLRDQLAGAGVAVRPATVVAEAGDQLPLPGTAEPPLGPSYPADAAAQVDLGTRQAFRGDYDAGLATLDAVLQAAHANPQLVVADAGAPAWLTKAYAATAFAHLRRGRSDAATAAIAEQIRSFPDRPIGRLLGPEVAGVADTVRKALDAGPHGALRIAISQPDVQVFVDEQPRGQGRAFPNLVPGSYRILLVRGELARRYTAVVVADRNTDLRIDWTDDSAFRATPAWIGFAWPADRDNTEDAASRYARSGRRHDVLVAGLVERGGRRFATGAIFEKQTGALVRRKAVDLGGGAACLRALGQYLLAGDASPCVIDLPADAPPPPLPAPSPGDPYRLPGVVAGLGAMAVLGGVAVLAGKHDAPTGQTSPRYASAPGIGLVVAGGLALGAAGYLTLRAPGRIERSRAPLYAATGTALAAFAAGSYLLHINGTGTCGLTAPHACRYLYHTGRIAWPLLGLGAAATGFAIYWQLRTPADTLAIIPTGDGALAALAGRF